VTRGGEDGEGPGLTGGQLWPAATCCRRAWAVGALSTREGRKAGCRHVGPATTVPGLNRVN
jgi:hypothetical protein